MSDRLISHNRRNQSPVSDQDFRESFIALRKPCGKLVSKGVPGELLLDHWFKMIVSAAGPWRGPANIPSAMPWKNFKRFPKRIQKLAAEIEKLNSDRLLDPRTWMPALYDRAQSDREAAAEVQEPNRLLQDMQAASPHAKLGGDFFDLPMMLNLYAAYLSKLAEQIGRHRKERPDETEFRHWERSLLLEIHKFTGGNFYYADVATIVETAYCAAGKKLKITKDHVRGIVRSRVFQKMIAAQGTPFPSGPIPNKKGKR